MSGGMSHALELSLKEFSKHLVSLHDKTASELEVAEKEMHRLINDQSRDVRKSEQPTVQLLQFLCEMHTKSAIVSLGIDPFSMIPIVREDGDEMMF